MASAWLLLVGAVVILGATRLVTGLQYHYTLRQLRRVARNGQNVIADAPVLPYWVPFIGHASLLVRRRPGTEFWNTLLARHPRDAGLCTLQTGGKRMHLLWNVTAINAMFKSRTSINRGEFDRDLWVKAFALSPADYESMDAHRHAFHDMRNRLLMRRNAVDELTSLFIEQIVKNFEAQPEGERDVLLFDFLRRSMFEASIDTMFGTKLREDFYPDMIGDFDKFDADMPSFYFGLPRFMAPSMYSNREKILGRMKAWNDSNLELQPRDIAEAEEQSKWDADLGSRYNRVKHAVEAQAEWSTDANATADMAFVMGLSANVIRTTGWMALHVVGSSENSLMPRVLREVANAKAEGSKNAMVEKLVSSPLLQSLWTESLRCYVDNYTPRNIIRDMDLPLDESGQRFVRLKAGDIIFASNHPVQTDPGVWGEDAFHAERFITTDANGTDTFQPTGKAAKVFPFGGGPDKCPGRIFAKQEAIAAVGLLFSHFDVEPKGFVDGDGQPTDQFPIGAPRTAGSGAQCPGGDICVKLTKRV